MKKNYLFLSLMAGVLMAGCSSGDELSQDEKIVERNTTNFIRVNITQSGTATRAGETFDVGTDSERKISQLLFAFYDAAGNNIASQIVGSNPLEWTQATNPGDNISDTRSIVVPVNLQAGMKIPSKMMVFANYTQENQVGEALVNIPTKMREQFQNSEGNFTMNNSVYFDAGGNKQMEVPIKVENFATSEEEALNNPGIEVNLERIAAKVTVKMGEGVAPEINELQSGTDKDNKYYLKFYKKSWGLNALEKKSYLTKQFGDATYSNLNGNLNSTDSPWEWNDVTNKRCYWARSISYPVTDKFPQVYDDIYDNKADAYTLQYVSYNSIVNKTDNKGADYGAPLYCMEHTMSAPVLNGDYKNSAVTSAIIAGEYRIYSSKEDANADNDNYLKLTANEGETRLATFYVYGDQNSPQVYVSDDEILEGMAKGQNIIKKQKTGGEPEALSAEDYATVFEIKHPTTNERKATKVGESYITILLKDTPTLTDTDYKLVYLNAEGKYVEYQNSAKNDANLAIYQQVGMAEKFNEGKSYYGVLIEHLRPQLPAAVDGTVQYLTGNYGIVRNHSYNLNIQGIKGLGVGIDNPEHEIVLPTNTMRYYVKMTLNVLSWRVVNTQNVTLDKPIQ
ncbi:MAG: fimbria major subunit [Prevotellaceae bacterium]|nr:fimbria major subunit [Prevotellaceae bacterium]MDO4932700.1 fimbria major subunit [Prevotellaceae bacterium]